MDNRTLLAVVLSVVIISVGFMLQNVLWPPEPPAEVTAVAPETGEASSAETGTTTTSDTAASNTTTSTATSDTTVTAPVSHANVVPVPIDVEFRERTVVIETERFIATLSNRGGEITSLKLKEQLEDGLPVEMVFSGESSVDPFFITFGGPDDTPVDALFQQTVRGQYSVVYSRDFVAPAGSDGQSHTFKLIKTYTFKPNDYMFELDVTIHNSVNEFPNIDFNGISYTLGYGPQIGPSFDHLGGRGEYRYYYTYEDGKRQNNRMGRNSEIVLDTRFNWAGIVGKYFALLAIADDADYTLTFNQPRLEGLPSSSFMYLSRPVIKGSKNTDTYRFYVGPKTRKLLGAYNNAADNPFSLADRNMDTAVDSSALLGWLMVILRFILDAIYRVIPNYGVAIILLTVFVKAILFPITRKSYESTSKMQAVTPQVNEIKEKFKDNPTRMNQEMAALYKREKVSPLGGCLPLLLQMPLFLAMYRVMSSHFALRGAPFFWWINDLSAPDSVLSFGSFTLPVLGWTDLRILPIIYVVTQIISTKFMQQPNTQSSGNMKLMTQLLPIFFFFILYNVPSGLLLYWISTNILTAAQQKFISHYMVKHPGDDTSTNTGTGKGKPSGPGPGKKGPGGGKKKPRS